jgi:outer membrane protein OmpA-like peptidoglycan-associated protein
MPTPAMKLALVLVLAACGAPSAPSKTTPAPSTTSAPSATASIDDRPPCPDRVIIQDDLRLLPRVPECAKNEDEPLVDATPAFDEMTKLMTEYAKLEIGIVGHASEDEKDPDALSDARARRFRDELVKRGVSAARLEVHGVGTKRPCRKDAGAP